ncbi:hypothetical protein ACFFX0_10770 [Citricoccus parietis]|uniref:Uncharacterized protein n=1 Tax=Citricoccus parietis TaxID=592307 RepID=A0ABV5FY88_9MICC
MLRSTIVAPSTARSTAGPGTRRRSLLRVPARPRSSPGGRRDRQ